MKAKYEAAMILAGVGDAMGYKNGKWEFCFDGEKIHSEVEELGGIEKLHIVKPDFIVSDDTVMLLSTAEGLVKESNSGLDKLYSEIAFRYKNDFAKDMQNRAGGLTTANACFGLNPHRSKGWHIDFNPRGGGCGGAMRSMCIGLRYPDIFDVQCLELLIQVSVESGRMTHNHPTGYLGSFASALFGALAINRIPLISWGKVLMSLLPSVQKYVIQAGRDVELNVKNWDYFSKKWEDYLELRNLTSGEQEVTFPESYTVKERDAFYKSLAFRSWGGSSGHDAPMIAYDALLASGDDWVKLCKHGMLHSGNNDSTGVIGGFCFGAMYGTRKVPRTNYKNVEYKGRLEKSGESLYKLAVVDKYLKRSGTLKSFKDVPYDRLFTGNLSTGEHRGKCYVVSKEISRVCLIQ